MCAVTPSNRSCNVSRNPLFIASAITSVATPAATPTMEKTVTSRKIAGRCGDLRYLFATNHSKLIPTNFPNSRRGEPASSEAGACCPRTRFSASSRSPQRYRPAFAHVALTFMSASSQPTCGLPIPPPSPPLPLPSSFRPQQRKQNHIPNRMRIRQQHRQPVNPDPFSRRRRHPMRQRPHIIHIQLLRRLIPACAICARNRRSCSAASFNSENPFAISIPAT